MTELKVHTKSIVMLLVLFYKPTC